MEMNLIHVFCLFFPYQIIDENRPRGGNLAYTLTRDVRYSYYWVS